MRSGLNEGTNYSKPRTPWYHPRRFNNKAVITWTISMTLVAPCG